jgi:hypothetical protein
MNAKTVDFGRCLAMILLAWCVDARADGAGNLLRNAEFQDDWTTQLPETKNHHWCYASEFANRRDYNPDGWTCRGHWEWQNADLPAGSRRFVLQGPGSEIVQRVNWISVHDDRRIEGFPDAGGFPSLSPQRSRTPLRVVRDLTFRVLVKGEGVPAEAGTIELGLARPGATIVSDPLGEDVAPTALASAPLPSGTYEARWVTVTLPAEEWLAAARRRATVADDAEGPILPGSVRVAVRYTAKNGSLSVERAELVEKDESAPNILGYGEFEEAADDGYPEGWSGPCKYRYFPPRLYYIFNTWHNRSARNRGPVEADELVCHGGRRSLKMIVASGDEVAVTSDPLLLNQAEPRLIEVHAWVKTDRLSMLQIDAVDESGQRLDGCNFIHKAPVSIGTDDWRLIRQVFRPRVPARSIRLMLCARGVNGYTLDDTDSQPQNNVTGTVWWDDVRVSEPESTTAELTARGVSSIANEAVAPGPRLERLDLGERALGINTLSARIVNPGPAKSFVLEWQFTSPSGARSRFASSAVAVPEGGSAPVTLTYELAEPCPTAYTEFRGTLSLREEGEAGKATSTRVWFGTWTTPVDMQLGALYLRPEQPQFVRMNLGFAAATLRTIDKIQLELVRRGTGKLVKGWEFRDVPAFIRALRERIPAELRDDLGNLLFAQLDLSSLPLQPFENPERPWLIRARVLDTLGHELGRADSPPFCRLAHDSAQPPIESVQIDDATLRINGRAWVPWGAVYNHFPLYAGETAGTPVVFRDLHNLPPWNLYDRLTSESYTRTKNDFNCLRYVAGSITDRAVLEARWKGDNLYAATAFVIPQPAFSVADLEAQAGGRAKLEAGLEFLRTAPMVASVAPGIEESFGLFQGKGRERLQGLERVVEQLRRQSGKPVMVGHGGFWNRFEFEKVPFFDIYDPETEPLYPANLHTDLGPLVQGRNKVIWLRPQMYEDVPYERWRFHAYVELMRGCRGWQIAHGPGDTSLFRGLHAELAHLRPAMASKEAVPAISVEPWIEHWARRHDGTITIIAATTRGIPFGAWDTHHEREPTEAGRITRRTGKIAPDCDDPQSDADNSIHVHGVDSLPDSRAWPAGSTIRQWVWLHPDAPPKNVMVLAKADGRWTHATAWGDPAPLDFRANEGRAFMFLKAFYRQAEGFLGWDQQLVHTAVNLVPDRPQAGPLPAIGRWVRLEVPLATIGATDRQLDGVGLLHTGGTVYWGHTAIAAPNGTETVIWGDSLALAPDRLAAVRFKVPGLKAGSPVHVLFEDRTIAADDGSFVDDFRGQDLYQRYGGEHTGYGRDPVALHAYEIDSQ